MTENTLPTDRIFLRDHVRQLDIGAFSEERGNLQSVSFSVTVDVAPAKAITDDVDAILSYDTILDAIDATLADARFDLLEALAEGIAARVLDNPQARQVSVKIEKLDRVPGRLGVEITRSGDGFSGASEQPSARVYCLAPVANVPPLRGGPNIIAIEGQPEKTASNPAISRRLDLLASEAAAWGLSEFLDQAPVVASRTELRHALATGQTALWAPSKMVFDAAGGVESVPVDFGELCGWLAEEMQARELVFVGRDVPRSLSFSGKISKVD